MGKVGGPSPSTSAHIERTGSLRPASSGPCLLRLIWRNKMRDRGFSAPAWAPALRRLRPAGGYRVTSVGEVFKPHLTQLVCRDVQEHCAQRMLLFGAADVVCDPDDAVLRHGGSSAGAVHRDCSALSRDFRQLQFIAVLQGSVQVVFQRRVAMADDMASQPHRRRDPVSVGANRVLVFFGSRYAHAVEASANCVRVTGWVCQEGARVALQSDDCDLGDWA